MYRCFLLLMFAWSMAHASAPQADMGLVPVLHNGRIRPFEAYSQLAFNDAMEIWISHFSKQESINVNAQQVTTQFLSSIDPMLKLLPSKFGSDWLPLRALKASYNNKSIFNFTPYSEAIFKGIQLSYLNLERAVAKGNPTDIDIAQNQLAHFLLLGYRSLAGKAYKSGSEKSLFYPSLLQLKAEMVFYRYPFVQTTLWLYGLAVLILCMSLKWSRMFVPGVVCLSGAFLVHSIILGLRIYILQRPPVSNMYETLLYVPWITLIVGFALYKCFKKTVILTTAAATSLILFFLMQQFKLNSGLENVQAVLDSQYWLLIHVLLVVGSYGAFILAGLLGHIYLVSALTNKRNTHYLDALNKSIVQSIYVGVAMLIPGTILGGVWAAESWGRFWDWDPKESWAFISICTYLIWIHAYRYHYIETFGIAIGSIVGLLAISFTWYGVNYVLGTGLHSYGFGSGGEYYYGFFVISELLFIAAIWYLTKIGQKRLKNKA